MRRWGVTGDSLGAGVFGVQTAAGGRGSWVELLFAAIANLLGKPLVGPGVRFHLLELIGGGVTTEWTHTGTWTLIGAVPWASVPYGIAYTPSAGATLLWTKPRYWPPVVSLCIWYLDYPGGGNWQYRIDGGTWTNMNQTLFHDANGKMCKFYLNVSVNSTVEFRANDGTSNVGMSGIGVDPFWYDPKVTDGVMYQNVSIAGQKLHNTVTPAAAGADPLQFFDGVRYGSGSPPAHEPNSGTYMIHINDDTLNASPTVFWDPDLRTLNTRVSTLGPVTFITPYEVNSANVAFATQTAYRAQTKTTAAAVGAHVVDFYDIFSALGIVGNIAAFNAGFLAPDKLHASQRGHFEMWPSVFALAHQLLAVDGPARYPVKAISPVKQYTGSRPARVYTAGAPIMVPGANSWVAA